uniref:Uncharacterized protein n=1 Tax=Romanomermis culicivorax TaxID=13658 RepID=A0A915IJ96_ROMCU
MARTKQPFNVVQLTHKDFVDIKRVFEYQTNAIDKTIDVAHPEAKKKDLVTLCDAHLIPHEHQYWFRNLKDVNVTNSDDEESEFE